MLRSSLFIISGLPNKNTVSKTITVQVASAVKKLEKDRRKSKEIYLQGKMVRQCWSKGPNFIVDGGINDHTVRSARKYPFCFLNYLLVKVCIKPKLLQEYYKEHDEYNVKLAILPTIKVTLLSTGI